MGVHSEALGSDVAVVRKGAQGCADEGRAGHVVRGGTLVGGGVLSRRVGPQRRASGLVAHAARGPYYLHWLHTVQTMPSLHVERSDLGWCRWVRVMKGGGSSSGLIRVEWAPAAWPCRWRGRKTLKPCAQVFFLDNIYMHTGKTEHYLK